MKPPFLQLLMLALVATGLVHAQVADPTRPAGTPVAAGVQTIILRPDGKSGAVIYGDYVEVGDRIGDRRVLKITETEVTLSGENGIDVLKVMSSIEKKTKKAAPVVGSAQSVHRSLPTSGDSGKGGI